MNRFNFWLATLLTCASFGAARSETLEEYARVCDATVGVTVPDFDCDAGTVVPDTHPNGASCDRPDQLVQDCDPGSRFQVLTNTQSATVVAHCRKRGNAPGNSQYGDIAVIQYSKTNGGTCFYQALGVLDGHVKAPSKGTAAWSWKAPADTASIGCARCHDNGALIRSPYLTQITGSNRLPGAGDRTFNRDQPYAFIGADFAGWKAFKVEIAGNFCNGCHRLGVSNLGQGNGTAQDFAVRATTEPQRNKNQLSVNSPLWMLPGQSMLNAFHQQSANDIKACADKFRAGQALPPGCTVTQFAATAAPPSPPPNTAPVECAVFDDGNANRSFASQAIYFDASGKACVPDGTPGGLCRKWFGTCHAVGGGASVTMRVFDDGATNKTALSDAIFASAASSECIPSGTATGTCRKWFGLGETSDRHSVTCYIFDDGLSNWAGPTDSIFFNGSKVCMPDGTASGTCRKWFGNCQVGAALPPLPQPLKVLVTTVSPFPVTLNRFVTVTVRVVEFNTNTPVAATIRVNGTSVGTANTPFTFRFATRRVGRPPNVEIVNPQGTATAPGFQSAGIDFGFPDSSLP